MIATHVKVQARDRDGNPIFDAEGRPVMGVAINPVKPFVRQFWVNGQSGNPPSRTIALAANGKGTVEFIIDTQGDFDWAYIVGRSTGAFVLTFEDPGKSRLLNNRPVHSSLIVGNAQRPFRLPEPYFFNVGDSQRVLVGRLLDISGAPNTVELELHGRRFYHRDADPDVALEIRKTFGQGERTFSYFLVPGEYNATTGLPPTLPANGTLKLSLQSDAGADTEIMKWMATSTGRFTVSMFDRSKNKFLMNDVVVDTNIFGNAEFPFIPADSFLLERQKYMDLLLTDLSGSDNIVYICAAGRRLQLIP